MSSCLTAMLLMSYHPGQNNIGTQKIAICSTANNPQIKAATKVWCRRRLPREPWRLLQTAGNTTEGAHLLFLCLQQLSASSTQLVPASSRPSRTQQHAVSASVILPSQGMLHAAAACCWELLVTHLLIGKGAPCRGSNSSPAA